MRAVLKANWRYQTFWKVVLPSAKVHALQFLHLLPAPLSRWPSDIFASMDGPCRREEVPQRILLLNEKGREEGALKKEKKYWPRDSWGCLKETKMLGLIQIPLKLMETFQWALDRTSAVKWNGEIMNGFGDKQIGKWRREVAHLYRRKWSGREKRAHAVENSDRAWQLTAQELGNDLKILREICLLGVCGVWQQTRPRNAKERRAPGWLTGKHN